MKTFLYTTILFFVSITSYPQQYDFPEDYKLETPKDYSTYEKEVVKSLNWLVAAPTNKHKEKRKKINIFLLEWILGAPNISISINSEFSDVTNNDDFYMIFIGGWAKYAIETGDTSNEVEGNIAGIKSLITYYKKNRKALGKIKYLEKYIKLDDKGKLESYINSRL
ncbi:hypothetical protein D7030_11370 [Flavobacteriaceae bacterium AU392]|nr:hypothetical protein D1817_13300 [Flavobacteriaceae bacterium]RKM82757.1 hypothetical protein D7030_11370 [Flavobacteriaceae bacterium AU392]